MAPPTKPIDFSFLGDLRRTHEEEAPPECLSSELMQKVLYEVKALRKDQEEQWQLAALREKMDNAYREALADARSQIDKNAQGFAKTYARTVISVIEEGRPKEDVEKLKTIHEYMQSPAFANFVTDAVFECCSIIDRKVGGVLIEQIIKEHTACPFLTVTDLPTVRYFLSQNPPASNSDGSQGGGQSAPRRAEDLLPPGPSMMKKKTTG